MRVCPPPAASGCTGVVGEALEAVYVADPGPHLAELAHHFVAAAPGGEVDRAVRVATAAGRRALEVLAWEEAGPGLVERALAALELAERPDQHRRCQLLLAVGEARRAASDVAAAPRRTSRPPSWPGGSARRTCSPGSDSGLGLVVTGGIVNPAEAGLLEEVGTSGVVDSVEIGLLEEALAPAW